jgi:hypothetical protein
MARINAGLTFINAGIMKGLAGTVLPPFEVHPSSSGTAYFASALTKAVTPFALDAIMLWLMLLARLPVSLLGGEPGGLDQ